MVMHGASVSILHKYFVFLCVNILRVLGILNVKTDIARFSVIFEYTHNLPTYVHNIYIRVALGRFSSHSATRFLHFQWISNKQKCNSL